MKSLVEAGSGCILTVAPSTSEAVYQSSGTSSHFDIVMKVLGALLKWDVLAF